MLTSRFIKSAILLLSSMLMLQLSFANNAQTNSAGASTSKANHQHSATQYLSDSAITAKVKTILLADKDIKSFDISVNTVKGKVTLTGSVDNKSQKHKAKTLVKNVSGVKVVINKLIVKPKQ